VEIHRDFQNHMREAGRLDEIREEYRRRAASRPRDASAQYLAARIEKDEALEAGMKRALEIDAGTIWAHRALAQYYAERRRIDDSVRHLEAAAASRDATLDDAKTLLANLYAFHRLERIDRAVEGWLDRPPAFAREEAALQATLGRRPGGTKVALSIAVDPTLPYLFTILFTRGDGTHRQIYARRSGQKFAVAWWRSWLPLDQQDQEPETWEVKERPLFTDLHSAATSRLVEDR